MAITNCHHCLQTVHRSNRAASGGLVDKPVMERYVARELPAQHFAFLLNALDTEESRLFSLLKTEKNQSPRKTSAAREPLGASACREETITRFNSAGTDPLRGYMFFRLSVGPH
jgi:hypothetical protein